MENTKVVSNEGGVYCEVQFFSDDKKAEKMDVIDETIEYHTWLSIIGYTILLCATI